MNSSIYGGLTIEHLTAELLKLPQESMVQHGFKAPHSYRGYYEELGVEPTRNVTVASMVATLEYSLGTVFTGYKGGDFTMMPRTGVHLAHYGNVGEPVTSAWLELVRIEAAERRNGEPVMVVISMTYEFDDINDEMLDAALDDAHDAYGIPKEYFIDEITVNDISHKPQHEASPDEVIRHELRYANNRISNLVEKNDNQRGTIERQIARITELSSRLETYEIGEDK